LSISADTDLMGAVFFGSKFDLKGIGRFQC